MKSDVQPQRRAADGSESGTRQALLDAGRRCVRDHGVAKTTSRLIAATAGANLAAITYYFGSKDELLVEALLGDLAERFEPVITFLRDDSQPAAMRLLSAMQMLVAEFDRSAADVRAYLDTLLLSTQSGELGDRVGALLSEVRAELAAVMSTLKSDGVIATWVEPDAMASLLVATGNGIALQSQLEPDGANVAQLARQLANLLLAAATPDGRAVGPAVLADAE